MNSTRVQSCTVFFFWLGIFLRHFRCTSRSSAGVLLTRDASRPICITWARTLNDQALISEHSVALSRDDACSSRQSHGARRRVRQRGGHATSKLGTRRRITRRRIRSKLEHFLNASFPRRNATTWTCLPGVSSQSLQQQQ
uniref:Predicted protein n=1 Tax=Hordeum vulgare subsp. vulgare TaxID=112509 RepID=F2EDA5_HORVV|nr:predicted protein [Hordeum vulgare subsp. vulgare]